MNDKIYKQIKIDAVFPISVRHCNYGGLMPVGTINDIYVGDDLAREFMDTYYRDQKWDKYREGNHEHDGDTLMADTGHDCDLRNEFEGCVKQDPAWKRFAAELEDLQWSISEEPPEYGDAPPEMSVIKAGGELYIVNSDGIKENEGVYRARTDDPLSRICRINMGDAFKSGDRVLPRTKLDDISRAEIYDPDKAAKNKNTFSALSTAAKADGSSSDRDFGDE